MQKTLNYRILFFNLLVGLFISVFALNSIGVFFWNQDSIAIELNDVKDSESEKEESKTEKDSEDKIQLLTDKLYYISLLQFSRTRLWVYTYSFPCQETPTPPPQLHFA